MGERDPAGAVSSTAPRVLVVLCEELIDPPTDEDRSDLRIRIEACSGRPVSVEAVPGVCRRPELLAEVPRAPSADHVVVAVCRQAPEVAEYALWVDRAGFDPFALELVSFELEAATLAGAPRTGRIARSIAAAVDKTMALRPDGARRAVVVGEPIGRRAVLSRLAVTDAPVAAPDPEACVGIRRCGLCIGACPTGAVSAFTDRPSVDPGACTGCARCVAACPVGVMDLAGSSLQQHEAQLRTLLGEPTTGVVLACADAAVPDGWGALGDAGWSLVRVPCLDMVTPGWVLTIAASGARTMLLPARPDCALAWDGMELGRLHYCRRVLEGLGARDPVDGVRLIRGGERPPEPSGRGSAASGRLPVVLVDPASTAIAVLRLAAERPAAVPVRIAHPASPLGVLRFLPEACTACGACSTVCPTAALDFTQGASYARLEYDAGRCLPCGRCVSTCPEGALEVGAETDQAVLATGPVELIRSAIRRCARCGADLGTAPTHEHVRDVAGVGTGRTLCGACALGVGSGRTSPRRP